MSRGSTVAMATGNNIRIEAMPSGKALEIEKAVRVDGTVVFLGKDGKVYCPRVKDGMYYGISDWSFIETLMSGLVKLGVITKKQSDGHIAEARKRDAIKAAKYNLERFDEIAKQYGVKVPTAQRAKIERAAQKGTAA